MAPPHSTAPPISPPIPRTRLIGREAERAAAKQLLLADAVPLLTLTGPGGVGKTRLALAIADEVIDRFADGLLWVDLAPLSDPSLVPSTVAQVLGVAQVPGRTIAEELIQRLRPTQTLLLLDNCEHVLEETAALTSALLAACPALQFLATSRAPIRIQGEYELPVDPLPLPPEDAAASAIAVGEYDAVRLFIERARAVTPALATNGDVLSDVAEICRRVDGLPLAIELAAGRTRILTPAAMRARLEQRLSLLTGGRRDAPARQRTIRDTIAWSYDLLSAQEQAVFRHLAVFAGGWTIDAALAVTGRGSEAEMLPSLERLVDLHLVRPAETFGEPRFSMLETLREFGLERLEDAGEADDARDRHAAYFLALVERLDANVFEHLPEAASVHARLQVEYPNLRAALTRFEATGAVEPFVRFAGTLHAFWIHQGLFQEGQHWLEQAIALGASASLPARVWAQVGLVGMLTNQRIEPERSLALMDEAVTLARLSGDGLAIGLATEWRGGFACWMGHLELAEACYTESRAAFGALQREPWIARNLTLIDARFAWIAFARGDLAAAESISVRALERMRALEREHNAPYLYASDALYTLGHVARARGDHVAALAHYQAALREGDQANDALSVLQFLICLAITLGALDRRVEAARFFGAAEAICERLGMAFDAHVWADGGQTWGGGMEEGGMWLWPDATFQPAGPGEAVPTSILNMITLLDPTLSSHWTAGRSMSVEDAVAEALAIDPLDPTHVPDRPAPIATANTFGLSPREREVLGLLCERLTNPEIAERLFISPRTASTHVAHLFNKLGVKSRREAAAFAARQGLI